MINSHKQESLQRGNTFFPVQYSLCNTSDPLYNLPIHWHLEMEIIHVLEGKYNAFINTSEMTIPTDEVCIITGGTFHGDGSKLDHCVYESIVFNLEMIKLNNYSPNNFIDEIIQKKVTPQVIYTNKDSSILSTCKNLFTVMKGKKEGYDLQTIGFIFQLLGLIKTEKKYTELTGSDLNKRKVHSEYLKPVFEYINNNYTKQISLEEMADKANLSPKYFCRVFHEVMHYTPFEYLNSFRINCACDKLRKTNEKIINVAYSCGFNDFSYFIKTFKRYKNMTPFKYRNYNGDEDDK